MVLSGRIAIVTGLDTCMNVCESVTFHGAEVVYLAFVVHDIATYVPHWLLCTVYA